jgi:hypothetical protein
VILLTPDADMAAARRRSRGAPAGRPAARRNRPPGALRQPPDCGPTTAQCVPSPTSTVRST